MQLIIRQIILILVVASFASAVQVTQSSLSSAWRLPKVEHHDEVLTTHYEVITHTCPDGLEAHYVDPIPGFESDYHAISSFNVGSNPYEQAYTVCFDRKFMEELRGNRDMLARKPIAARPL